MKIAMIVAMDEQGVIGKDNDLPWKNSRKGLLSNQPSDKEVIINKDTTVDFALDSHNRIPVVKTQNTLGHYSNF